MVFRNKIKSFTVVEMLVVLLITSIVIGIVFSVHQFVNTQFHEKNRLSKKNNSINLLEKELWKVLNNSITYVNTSAYGLVFKQGNLESKMIIEDDYIIYKEDTLKLYTKEFSFFNKGLEVDKGRVDAIKLTLEIKQNLHREVFVFKQEDVESILNNEN